MRPAFHFTARRGWINDPHGVTYRNGRYEAFYQYVPDSTAWQHNCHWGHASGPDLLSLTEGPVALAPGEGDDGIWTGSLVVDANEHARIFYTATNLPNLGIGRVRVAEPTDDTWDTWAKGPEVCSAPTDLDLIAYRDPFIRRRADGWQMFVGAGSRSGTAMALEYRSTDLEKWNYHGVALSRAAEETDPVWLGALWECPQFATVDDRDVMVSSVWDDDVLHYAGYALGTFQDAPFTATDWGRLTYGDSYYAPSLFHDADGAPCLLFWMRGIKDDDAGWASAHSVPYRLAVTKGRLAARPHPDVALHRGDASVSGHVDGLGADAVWEVSGDARLDIRSADAVAASIEAQGGSLTLTIPGAEPVTLPFSGSVRVIVDGPVLEVSSDGGLVGAAVSPQGRSLSLRASSGELSVYPIF